MYILIGVCFFVIAYIAGSLFNDEEKYSEAELAAVAVLCGLLWPGALVFAVIWAFVTILPRVADR